MDARRAGQDSALNLGAPASARRMAGLNLPGWRQPLLLLRLLLLALRAAPLRGRLHTALPGGQAGGGLLQLAPLIQLSGQGGGGVGKQLQAVGSRGRTALVVRAPNTRPRHEIQATAAFGGSRHELDCKGAASSPNGTLRLGKQPQPSALPASRPRRGQPSQGAATCPCRPPSTALTSSTTKARMGERSMPPRGGMMPRNRLRSGGQREREAGRAAQAPQNWSGAAAGQQGPLCGQIAGPEPGWRAQELSDRAGCAAGQRCCKAMDRV